MRMIRTGSKVFILATLAIVTILFAPIALQSEEIDLPLLQTNAVHTIGELRIGKKVFTTSNIIIKASPAQVWGVLTDYDGASAIFSNLTKSKLLTSSGPVKKVTFTAKSDGNLLRFNYILIVTEKSPSLIEWKRASGDFKENEGYWRLSPLDNGNATLVSYAKYIDGGLFLPQFLVKRSIRNSIPVIFAELKSAAESKQVATGKQ